jgi:hypothetical protein
MKICRNKDRSTPITHIHVRLLSWLGTGTSIKSDGDEQKEQVVILSEWIDFRSLIQIRINNIKRSMSTNERLQYSNILKLLKHCALFTTNILFLQVRPIKTSFCSTKSFTLIALR